MTLDKTKHLNNIEQIFEVILAFYGGTDKIDLLNTVLSSMMDITNSDAGTLYTIDNNELHFSIIRNNSLGIHQSANKDTIDLPSIPLHEDNIQNVSAYCAVKNEIVIINDVYEENSQFNFSGPRNYDKLTGYRTRAMLVLPICVQNDTNYEVLGVIQMINPTNPITKALETYENIYEPPIVPALAKIAGNALSNFIHVSEWHVFLRYFATVMTHAIDERSPNTSNHAKNVATYCEKFAVYLRDFYPPDHPLHLDPMRTESIALAAVLHDVGKITIPLTILNKSTKLGERIHAIRYRFALKAQELELDWLKKRLPMEQYRTESNFLTDAKTNVEATNLLNALTHTQRQRILSYKDLTYTSPLGDIEPILDEKDLEALTIPVGTLTEPEREIMQRHVTTTHKLLNNIPFWKYYGDIAGWAYAHHEFLDGSGYPQGLIGDQIPIESCIITIMDIFDALVDQNRPYKKGVSVEHALEILRNMANEGKLHKELVSRFAESKVWEQTSQSLTPLPTI